MTDFINKLKNDQPTQIKYSHLHGGGIKAGEPGLNWYCNTFALPEDESKCGGKKYKKGVVEKLGG